MTTEETPLERRRQHMEGLAAMPAELLEVDTSAMVWTHRRYPCGCEAYGPGDVPAYCGTHAGPVRG